jgi:hypothetical protein
MKYILAFAHVYVTAGLYLAIVDDAYHKNRRRLNLMMFLSICVLVMNMGLLWRLI